MHDFSKKPELDEHAVQIKGHYHKYDDWTMDPKGYVLIRVNREEEQLEVGFCKENNVIDILRTGRVPQDIYYEASKRNLLSRPEHYAYLGKELEKAYLALKNNLHYVQDEELEL